jgi:hypothetical protein
MNALEQAEFTSVRFKARNTNKLIRYKSIITLLFLVVSSLVAVTFLISLRSNEQRLNQTIGQVEICIAVSLCCVIFFNIPYKFQTDPLLMVDSFLNALMGTSVLLLNLVFTHSLSRAQKIDDGHQHLSLAWFYLPKVIFSCFVFCTMYLWQYADLVNYEKFFSEKFVMDEKY